MLVVGIDPGSQQTGVAYIALKQDGKISRAVSYLKDTGKIPFRYAVVRNKLENYLKSLPEKPYIIAIEEPGYWFWPDSTEAQKIATFRLHAVYGVCVAELSRSFPDSVMMSVKTDVWRGGMKDPDVVEVMKKKYKISRFNTMDEADALGVADHAFGIATNVWKRELGKVE